MTNLKDILRLILKGIGIILFFRYVVYVIEYILYSSNFLIGDFIPPLIVLLLTLALIYIVFFLGTNVVIKMLRLEKDFDGESAIIKVSSTQIMEIALFGTGMWFIMFSLPDILYWIISRFSKSLSHNSGAVNVYFSYTEAQMGNNIIVFLLSLLIIVFRKPIIRFLN